MEKMAVPKRYRKRSSSEITLIGSICEAASDWSIFFLPEVSDLLSVGWLQTSNKRRLTFNIETNSVLILFTKTHVDETMRAVK